MKIDIHLDGAWQPCADIRLHRPEEASRRGAIALQYDADYALAHLGASDHRALTVRAPVDLGSRQLPCWPSFLIDLLPQGAARKRLEWLAETTLTEWALLNRGAINPVGNLRIRPDHVPEPRQHPGFELREMIGRGDAFIDYANAVGATVAGATDTQGEAPKFWVLQDEDGKWHPDDGAFTGGVRRYALLKFPVPEAGPRAAQILRNEAAYQRVAARLKLGVTAQPPRVIDEALLIPRFDRRRHDDREVRLGVESLYSAAGVLDAAQTPLRHHQALLALRDCLTDFDTGLLEYLRRDLLNLALGNRDNHGRNTAILKDIDGTIGLAPLFDLGPAFLDARALARVMRWDGETPDQTDWNHVLENLQTHFEEAGAENLDMPAIRSCLRDFAQQLQGLPAVMQDCGVDGEIIEQRRPQIMQLAGALAGVRP